MSTEDVGGVRALIVANYPAILVGKATDEVVTIQPLALRLLSNCLTDQSGLETALGFSAIDMCLTLLGSNDPTVRCEATTTLFILCFADIAKVSAIQAGAVKLLIALLKDPERLVRTAAAAALMAITTTDRGKHAFVASGEKGEIEACTLLVRLLGERDEILVTNTLKCVANVAVHPKAREELRKSAECLELLSKLCIGDNAALAKHASIAKKVVTWEP